MCSKSLLEEKSVIYKFDCAYPSTNSIQVLNVSGNALTESALGGNSVACSAAQLIILDLSHNRIRELFANSFDNFPTLRWQFFKKNSAVLEYFVIRTRLNSGLAYGENIEWVSKVSVAEHCIFLAMRSPPCIRTSSTEQNSCNKLTSRIIKSLRLELFRVSQKLIFRFFRSRHFRSKILALSYFFGNSITQKRILLEKNYTNLKTLTPFVNTIQYRGYFFNQKILEEIFYRKTWFSERRLELSNTCHSSLSRF